MFSRAFVELCMEVRVELLQSFCRAFAELLQSFGRALCRASVELRAELHAEPHVGVCTGD